MLVRHFLNESSTDYHVAEEQILVPIKGHKKVMTEKLDGECALLWS